MDGPCNGGPWRAHVLEERHFPNQIVEQLLVSLRTRSATKATDSSRSRNSMREVNPRSISSCRRSPANSPSRDRDDAEVDVHVKAKKDAK